MKYVCTKCKAIYHFNESKIPEDGIRYKCPKCANVVFIKKSAKVASTAGTPEEIRYEEDSRSFIVILPTVFVYPFLGNGLWVLIAGTLAFGIVAFFRHYNIIPFVDLIIGVIISGYLAAFLMKIISDSADGKNEVPDFPDFDNFWDSTIEPALKVAGVSVFPLLPALAYYFLARPELGFMDPIVILLFFIGLFFIPMCLLIVSLSESLAAVNPLFIIPSIFKVFGTYILAFGVLVVIVLLKSIMNKLFISVPLLGFFIEWFLTLYFIMLEARIIGLVYYTNREKLNWL